MTLRLATKYCSFKKKFQIPNNFSPHKFFYKMFILFRERKREREIYIFYKRQQDLHGNAKGNQKCVTLKKNHFSIISDKNEM